MVKKIHRARRKGRQEVSDIKKAPLKKSVYNLINQVTTDFLWQLPLILEVKHCKLYAFSLQESLSKGQQVGTIKLKPPGKKKWVFFPYL